MSYLGAVGQIMGGSGIHDLLSTVYAESSVKYMLSGHEYARAVRGHILIHTAIAKLVFLKLDFSEWKTFKKNSIQNWK